jgi:hypothetical protein
MAMPLKFKNQISKQKNTYLNLLVHGCVGVFSKMDKRTNRPTDQQIFLSFSFLIFYI